MKNNIFFKAAAFAGIALAMTSCSEEKIWDVDQAGLAKAADYRIVMNVDPETNAYSLSFTDAAGNQPQGVYPIWMVYTKNNPVPSTRFTYKDICLIAGDYPIELQIGNHNGISEESVKATLHIEQTIFNYAPYLKALTGGTSKDWQIAGDQKGHMGCGPQDSDGLDWWNADPGAKENEGVYKNKLTFADNGGTEGGLYTFDPGASGTVYLNWAITDLPPISVSNPNDGTEADYTAPAQTQSDVPFTLTAEGSDLMLTLAPNTLWPYIPSTDAYRNPKFKVLSAENNSISLVQNLSGIAWHYELCPFGKGGGNDEDSTKFTGFQYDSEFNMWKNADVQIERTWFADDNWGEFANQPEVTLTPTKGFKVTTPSEMGNSQWQGQVHVLTDIQVSESETYDFSCFVTADVDSKVTVKVQSTESDDIYFVADQQVFKAGGSTYYFSDLSGFDGTLKIAFDFAGYPDTEFTVDKIVFKKHSDDDGTVLPPAVTFDDADNMFLPFEPTVSYWFADENWTQFEDPEVAFEGNSFRFVIPDQMGSQQWMGQFHMVTGVATEEGTNYDFMLAIYSDQELPGVTVKLQQDGDDSAYYCESRVLVKAGVITYFSLLDFEGRDYDNLQLCMDFGGSPAGAEVIVSQIALQKHK